MFSHQKWDYANSFFHTIKSFRTVHVDSSRINYFTPTKIGGARNRHSIIAVKETISQEVQSPHILWSRHLPSVDTAWLHPPGNYCKGTYLLRSTRLRYDSRQTKWATKYLQVLTDHDYKNYIVFSMRKWMKPFTHHIYKKHEPRLLIVNLRPRRHSTKHRRSRTW